MAGLYSNPQSQYGKTPPGAAPPQSSYARTARGSTTAQRKTQGGEGVGWYGQQGPLGVDPGSASLAGKEPDAPSKERAELEGMLPQYKKAGEDYQASYEETGQNYLTGLGDRESKYQVQLQGLMNESENMGKLATETYSDVGGRLRGVMDRAGTEAGGAMTLAQSQDPNNPVAQAFRQFYEQQAQGSRQAGMADVGVMQALGAQAFGGQMGAAGPMTGGQMSAMMGQNQSQAGMAMANVQRRVQDLRDQGIAQGWDQTDKAYDRGTEARDFYSQSIGDYEGAHSRHQGLMGGLRGEREGYGENLLSSRGRVGEAERGFGMDKAGIQHAFATGDLDKQTSIITGEYDRRSADRRAEEEASAARYAASQARQGAMYGGMGALAGGIGGGLIAASDIRFKKDITRIKPEDAAEFMEKLEPVMYRYKNEGDSSPEHIGLIAQDIKDTELGKRVVEDRDGMLFIKKDELVGALLACVKLLGVANAV